MPQIEAFKGVIKIQKKFSVSIKAKKEKNNIKAFIFFGSLLFLTFSANVYGIAHLIGYKTTSLFIPLLWNGVNMFFLTTIFYFLITRTRAIQSNLIPFFNNIQVEASPIKPGKVYAMSMHEIIIDVPLTSAKENIKVILNDDHHTFKLNSTLKKILNKKDDRVKAIYTFTPTEDQKRDLVDFFLHQPVADFFNSEQNRLIN
jgi:hypothetical protein